MLDWLEKEKYLQSEEGHPMYQEIRKLHEMLDEYGIEHSFNRRMTGYAIRIELNPEEEIKGRIKWISCVEFDGSYGSDLDNIEYWTWELDNNGMDPMMVENADTMINIIEYILCVNER